MNSESENNVDILMGNTFAKEQELITGIYIFTKCFYGFLEVQDVTPSK